MAARLLIEHKTFHYTTNTMSENIIISAGVLGETCQLWLGTVNIKKK
jgi:hypothetical protein